ncbi:hypothetical protein ACHAWF_013122 [Thalassiosira exigua]
MSKSLKLAQLDKLDVVAWYLLGVPVLGLTRDACYRAVGCDCMREDGSILLVAVGLNDTEEHGVKDALKDEGEQGARRTDSSSAYNAGGRSLVDTASSSFLARDAVLSTLEIPPVPRGMGRGRMTIRNFVASVDILAPTAARTKMVVNVDPNLALIPQFMIDFCMKRMCGILLTRLQTTARKVVKDPVKNAHARRMREDVSFYRDWLLPKFRLYCDELGWRMPKVGAFEIEEDELRAEGTGWIDDNVRNSTRQRSAGPTVSEADSSVGSPSPSPTEASLGSKSRWREKLGRVASAPRGDELASARERAELQLQPKPFSDSRAKRLEELKAAKLRAEERVRARTASSEDSVASFASCGTLGTTFDYASDGEVRRFAGMLVFSLPAQAAMLLLRRWIPSLDATERTALALREGIGFAAIALQATALYSLLCGAICYAFDEIDFGQKKLVLNMEYGKRYFVGRVKKVSFVVAGFVAAASCGFAFIAGTAVRFCPSADADEGPPVSLWWQRLPRIELQKLLYISADNADALGAATSKFADVAKTIVLGAMSKLSPAIPQAWTNVGFSALATTKDLVLRMSPAHWKVCRSTAPLGSRALDVNGFVTLRIGVFVLALMMMGHLLLPKPEKKSRRIWERKRRRTAGETEKDSGERRVISSPDASMHSFGARGHLTSMEVITEETGPSSPT